MDIFPDSSIAVQVTVVSPSGKTFGASFSNLVISWISDTLGVGIEIELLPLLVASTVMSDSLSNFGGTLSITVIFG